MENVLKILMLEDFPEDTIIIERTLSNAGIPFVSLRVDKRDEFINALKDFGPDIILSDHSLPQFNSIEALKICRSQIVNIPFILVTGTVSEDFAVTALKEGVDDYILKDNLSRLPSAILNTLKHRQEEAYKKMAEETLKGRNSELIKINHELDLFVYSASHDLKAPLKSILGILNLAELERENNNYHEMAVYHKMIQSSILKLNLTINEIEDYARNLRTENNHEKIHLRRIIRKVFNSLKYTEGADQLKIYLNVDAGFVITSDASRLKIILSNIFSNAIKYKNSGKEESYLSIRAEIKDRIVFIKIEDNGIGIHPDHIDKIGTMFFRATEKSEGSGLGMYIVKEILDKLNGSITVESTYKEKTLFTIQIPDNTNNEEKQQCR